MLPSTLIQLYQLYRAFHYWCSVIHTVSMIDELFRVFFYSFRLEIDLVVNEREGEKEREGERDRVK